MVYHLIFFPRTFLHLVPVIGSQDVYYSNWTMHIQVRMTASYAVIRDNRYSCSSLCAALLTGCNFF